MTVGYGESTFPNIVELAAGWLIAAYQLGYGLAAFGAGASLGSQSGWANAAKIITWIQARSQHGGLPGQGPGLAYRMVMQEWPVIKADIDAGRPSPLFLVMAPQCGTGDIPGIIDALGHSHQVLAYAYQLDDSDNLTLWAYDPDDHGNDNSTITLNISDPANTITITAPGIGARVGHEAVIRRLFRAQYQWASPAALGTSPYPQAFTGMRRRRAAPPPARPGQLAGATMPYSWILR